MARLPTPGSDSGQWGNILNEFLGVAHNSDGTLKDTAFIADGSITTVKLADGAVTGAKVNSSIIDPAAGVAGLRTLGTGANQAMPGNATVAASAHAATHKGGGSDVIDNATTTVAGLMSGGDKTKLDGIASGADVTNATTVNAAGAVMETDTSTASMQFVIDEDNMASNSATKVPTQQSVKAYVDANGNGDVTGPAGATGDNLVSFNGATGKIIKDSGKATPAGAIVGTTDTQALSGKTISGASNTLSNIGNGSLTNSSVTIGSTSVSLGATAATLAGLTLTTPTIASFTNATHNHTNAAGGGQLTDAALSSAVTVSKGGTGNTTATTAYGLIAAGTTATGAFQTIGPGSSGQILKSNGASALATFQTGAPGDVGLGNVTNDVQIKLADMIDEDDMASNSATKVPTQQSVKAYSDNSVIAAVSLPVSTKTANYNITAADGVILGNTTSGSFAVTLPTAVGVVRPFHIKKIAAANTLTINTTSSQTIDGGTSIAITALDETITVVSDGANWRII